VPLAVTVHIHANSRVTVVAGRNQHESVHAFQHVVNRGIVAQPAVNDSFLAKQLNVFGGLHQAIDERYVVANVLDLIFGLEVILLVCK